MSSYLPVFDELYVISDLHMGGERNEDHDFQIFNRGQRLRHFLRHIATVRNEENVALVINGDLVDTLAESELGGYVALDDDTAETVIKRIFKDASFTPVWDGLHQFVTTARRHLIFVIGNHDIEIALPAVEAAIRHRLGGDSPDAQSRMTFATHGQGFTCLVGDARVFCTHGNEVDDWNTVDYNALGQLGNALNAGRRVDSSRWQPNAGTRLVIDVMNTFKRRYPFVDLLKPETQPVLSILLTLEGWEALRKINLADAFPIVRDKIRGGLITSRLLAATAQDFSTVSEEVIAGAAVNRLLGPQLQAAMAERRVGFDGATEDDLLELAEEAVGRGRRASELPEAGEPGTLGWMDLVKDWLAQVPKEEALRRALLDWLKDDTTFEVTTEDDTFREIVKHVGSGVQYVVTGHTHLARAIKFDGNRYYYNCGTWIRLLRLTPEVLGSLEAFKAKAYVPLASGRMDDLDRAEIPGKDGRSVPLVFDRTNVVRIRTCGREVVGELLRVRDGTTPGDVTCDPEPETAEFRVV